MKPLTLKIHPITLGLILLIGLPAVAIAAGTILNPPVTVSGSMTGALLTATNQGSGGNAIALLGKSPSGRGVVGETSFNSTSTRNRESGVVGIDSSASGSFNAGVRGNSTVGTGVQGVSMLANGVDGQTSSATGGFAILGEDLNTTFAGNVGVAGMSSLGTGAEGISTGAGTGVFAKSADGTGLVAFSHDTGASITGSRIGMNVLAGSMAVDVGINVTSGQAIVANDKCSERQGCGSVTITANDGTQGMAVLARSFDSTAISAETGGGSNPTVLIESSATPAPGGATPLDIEVVPPSFNPPVMQLDTAGNMTIAGTLTQNGPMIATSRSSSGETDVTYVPRDSSAVVEDFGEAQLVSGRAYVALDSRFAALIDKARPYLVFVTPLGDSDGLFIRAKAANGFEVVESRGGRSNIAFDYRIVAKPYDSSGPRLPVYVKPRAQGQAVERLEHSTRP